MSVTVDVSFAAEAERGYQIRIGPGLLDDIAAQVRQVCKAHRYALITDDRVGGLYAERVAGTLEGAGMSVDVLTFPEGETNKNREWWQRLSDRMLELGIGRDAAVLALGGGVTGDLAGFVAATYLRGLPLVQLPTSVLAMIDSSVGGKTGVNTPAGKNLIGAFHQPKAVIADTATLETLAPEHLRSGLAEALKAGLIADAGYFYWIEENAAGILSLKSDTVVELVRRSVQIKSEVVSADEREGGVRKTLNFGHTIGHAIEAESGFGLHHGEAIAIGMVVEARMGETLGVTGAGTAAKIESVFRGFDLPTRVPVAMDPSRILEITRTDKKAREGTVEYALIERVGMSSRGTGHYGRPVDDEDVLSALRASAT